MYSQCINTFLGFCWPEEDQIHNGATVHVAYPKLTIPCLLMLWRLYEPEHHQTLYWSWSSKFPSTAPKELNYWYWLNAKYNINLGHDSHELLTWHAMHSALSRFYKRLSGLFIWYREKKLSYDCKQYFHTYFIILEYRHELSCFETTIDFFIMCFLYLAVGCFGGNQTSNEELLTKHICSKNDISQP